MDKNPLIQLTSDLYRLTLLFPKKEPLRYKMRELAGEILEDSVKLKSSNPSTKIIPEILKNIEILDNFSEVAKSQNWVSPQDLLKLRQEYSIVKEGLEKLLIAKRPLEIEPEKGEKKEVEGQGKEGVKISPRKQKILEVLRQREKVQVKDLKEIFPEMSKRTLRRDFEKLMKQGLIERIGEKQDTFYGLKVGQ